MIEKSQERTRVGGETLLVAWAALILAALCAGYCFRQGLLLLYGDAVSHLYIARRVFDSRNPGFRQLGTVWLPLPHLLLLPFVAVPDWWRNGLAGAWVGVGSYVLGCAGLYRLARVWIAIPMALVAVAFYALNPGLLYLATTAMTEPLYLAEMIWATLLLALFSRALQARVGLQEKSSSGSSLGERRQPSPERLLFALGVVLAAAIFTRYDGWILAAAAWLLVTLLLASGRDHDRRPAAKACWRQNPMAGAWGAFTLLLIAAPALWLAYNAGVFGDPLAFLRGPYSARAIEVSTSPPGAPPHPGFHSLRVSAIYFLKAAEMGAAPLRWSNQLLWLSILGTAAALVRFRRKMIWPLLLLWLPLPFYSYAIAYGSTPLFIPIWWPFSWYNTRYGLELLPAFALFGALFVDAALSLAPVVPGFHRGSRWGDGTRWTSAILLLLIVLNSFVLLRAGPLVFHEAEVNSRSRIAFEHALANVLLSLPGQGLILMDTSRDAGAIQLSGIPLKRTVNEGDGPEWQRGLEDPALAAPAVVALEGDPVARAVQRHPQGLSLIHVICSTGEPCARIYLSQKYTPRF